jgi:hypothetical protein
MPCLDGRVRLTGPSRTTSMLVEVLSSLRISLESLPVLDVTISPNARTAEGVVEGRLMWSIALPEGAAIGTLMGQIVGTFTTLLTRLVFVHAGVVALEGRGMVLVGESGAGKTSTVAALLRQGATYLSDEVALLDPEAGTALPFIVPMAVKSWTRTAAGMLPSGRTILREGGVEYWLPTPVESGPILVETFVLLRPGASKMSLIPLSRAAMLLALAKHASSFKQRHRVQQAFTGFSRLLRNAQCMVLETNQPASHADSLVALGRRSG